MTDAEKFHEAIRVLLDAIARREPGDAREFAASITGLFLAQVIAVETSHAGQPSPASLR